VRNSFSAQAAGHALGALIEFGREAEIGLQERYIATIDLGAVQKLCDHMCGPAQRSHVEQHFVGLLSLGIIESNELFSWQLDLGRSPTARKTSCSWPRV
jgi:hypothetical protein